jgi:predicted kinase
MNEPLIVPRRSLVVLCGPAGAGKSTFASELVERNRLASTAIVSSDTCRILLCDDTRSVKPAEWATLQPNTFDLFLTIVGMRMSIGRPAIADGVNLHMELRPRLLALARTHSYPSTLVVFDMSAATCLAHNAARARNMPEHEVRGQRQALDSALPHLEEEGWDHIVILNDQRRTAQIQLAD